MSLPADLVNVRIRASGRLHQRVRSELGTYRPFEACSDDLAEASDIVPDSVVEAAEPEDRCRRCFGGERE